MSIQHTYILCYNIISKTNVILVSQILTLINHRTTKDDANSNSNTTSTDSTNSNHNNTHNKGSRDNDTTVGFHNFNLRICKLRVSNPNKLIVDSF